MRFWSVAFLSMLMLLPIGCKLFETTNSETDQLRINRTRGKATGVSSEARAIEKRLNYY